MNSTLLIWLLVIPFVISLAVFTARWIQPSTKWISESLHLISVTVVLGMILAVIQQVLVYGPVSAVGGWLYVDSLAAIFLLIIGVIGFLVGIYSIGYLRHDLVLNEIDDRKLSTYYGLFNLFLTTMLLVVTANNIIMMWVAVEATTLGSAFLVGFYQHKSSLEAAWKYLVICTVGVAFGLYGIILVYSDSVNVLKVPETATQWTEIVKNASLLDPTILKLAFVFMLIGFGTKAGIFPMNAWLPDAYSEAPSPISAMLSAVLSNCALFILLRFFTIANLVLGPSFPQTLFLIFGTLSLGVATFFIYVQGNIKRLLAYSSIENTGLIVLAIGMGIPAAILGGLLHMVYNSLVKALMFCTSGNISIKYGSCEMNKVKGLLKVAPVTGVFVVAGALGLVGAPPFNTFISKFWIVTSGLAAGYIWLIILSLLLLMIVFTAFFRMINSTVFGETPEAIAQGDLSGLALAPIAVLLILVLALGIYMPPQLGQLLSGATSVVLNGN
jgi:hydrogenase-4 component F